MSKEKNPGRLWENLMFTALTSINSMNWQVAPPVAEPVLLQPSAFLFPLFAPQHLVQFAAPAQPSRHGKRIANRLCSALDSHTLDPQPAVQQFCLWAAEPEARAEQTKCHQIGLDMGEKWPASGKTSTNGIGLKCYEVTCERYFCSFPGQDEKGPAAPASESCSRCRSISCFCCSAKAAAEACCACTLFWKKRRGKAQRSNTSSIMFHGHIHHLAEILRNKMNQTVRHIWFQRWQFMILVNNLWLSRSPNRSASYLNFWKLFFQHLHLMTSACKTLQNIQAWNHYKSLLQQLGSYLFQCIYMTSHDKPGPSTGLKEKNSKAMRNHDFCINIHQSIPWTDKSPRLLLSLCFCSPQPFCFLCCIWCSSLLLPNHLNTAKELQRGFALRGIHTHPGPTACNSATWSLSCWTWSKGRIRLFATESVVKLFFVAP